MEDSYSPISATLLTLYTHNQLYGSWHKAEAGKHVTPRLSFGSIKYLFSAITEKRLELLRFVGEQKEVSNIRQLAQALGRAYKNVHTDVSELEELVLVEKDEKGALTVPYDEIVIHDGLTEAA